METVRAGVFFERERQRQVGHYAGHAPPVQLQKANITARAFLPHIEVLADVAVVNTTARTILTQVFSNYTDHAIEQASYSFPLYHSSVVTSFCCWHGKQTIRGKVKPKQTAKLDFQEAIKDNKAATLLEEHTFEVFETAIGNIQHGEDIKVEIQYLTELKADISGDGLLLTIPSSIAPRYGQPPGSYSSGPTSQPKPERGMRIQVDVSMPVPVRALRSRSHPISAELGSAGSTSSAVSFHKLARSSSKAKFDVTKARAVLSSKEATLGKDFVLVISAASSDDHNVPDLLGPRALSESCRQFPEFSAIQVAFTPRDLFPLRKEPPRQNLEVVLLADRSGSMGSKIKSLRRALGLFLSNLPNGCLFNVCAFGTSFESLWDISKPLSERNLQEAQQHVSGFEADMGGTEIEDALYKTASRTRKTSSTQVVVFTDGEVWAVDSVIDYVRLAKEKYGDALRFFTLGIGDEVSHQLIEGIAKHGGGFGEVVAVDSPDQWDDRVLRMLNGVFTASDWKLDFKLKDKDGRKHTGTGFLIRKHVPSNDWGDIIQVPYRLPVVHGFSRTTTYFIVDSSAKRYEAVSIEGITPEGKKFGAEIPIEEFIIPEPICHQLAAKALLNDFEAGYSWLHDPSLEATFGGNLAARQKEVDLEAEYIAMKWGLASKWTSFVGVSDIDSAEMASSLQRYGYDRRELNELMRPRGGESLLEDPLAVQEELRRRLENDTSGCNQSPFRRRDESDDEGGDGSNGGGPSSGPGPSSSTGAKNRGGSGTVGGRQQTMSTANGGSSRARGGPSDASEFGLPMETIAAKQDADGAFCSNEEATSSNPDEVFSLILRSFNSDVVEALERHIFGLQGIPTKDKKRVCRTVICITYLKRAFPETGKKESALDRAEQWLQLVVRKRIDRVKLEELACQHWRAGPHVELDMKLVETSSDTNATGTPFTLSERAVQKVGPSRSWYRKLWKRARRRLSRRATTVDNPALTIVDTAPPNVQSSELLAALPMREGDGELQLDSTANPEPPVTQLSRPPPTAPAIRDDEQPQLRSHSPPPKPKRRYSSAYPYSTFRSPIVPGLKSSYQSSPYTDLSHWPSSADSSRISAAASTDSYSAQYPSSDLRIQKYPLASDKLSAELWPRASYSSQPHPSSSGRQALQTDSTTPAQEPPGSLTKSGFSRSDTHKATPSTSLDSRRTPSSTHYTLASRASRLISVRRAKDTSPEASAPAEASAPTEASAPAEASAPHSSEAKDQFPEPAPVFRDSKASSKGGTFDLSGRNTLSWV